MTSQQTIINSLWFVIWGVFILVSVLSYLQDSARISGGIFVLIMAITFVEKTFLTTFEIRENGFIYRGKIILFSDIIHAEWEDLFDKTKLKIRLKSTGRTMVIRTPWEMLMPIDDYIRKNFPRP